VGCFRDLHSPPGRPGLPDRPGGHLANEQVSEYNAPQDEAARAYARSEARGRQSADELSKLADLRDRGVITDEEFQKGKVQLLG
jgi:hypothetical protein